MRFIDKNTGKWADIRMYEGNDVEISNEILDFDTEYNEDGDAILLVDDLEGTIIWVTEWATYNTGDEELSDIANAIRYGKIREMYIDTSELERLEYDGIVEEEVGENVYKLKTGHTVELIEMETPNGGEAYDLVVLA